jgi:DNA polymerase-3 subunit epsilon
VTDTTDTWIALDFETATSDRSSACSLAVVVVENGVIVEKRDWLIRPPGNRYDYHNIRVHGIEPHDTQDAPGYDALYPQIQPYLEDRYILAHWASFDVSVIRGLHEHYRIPLPTAHHVCTCGMARKAFPGLHNHQLPTVSDHCGIELQHHDAASDALACACVALHCRDKVGADSIRAAVHSLGTRVGKL